MRIRLEPLSCFQMNRPFKICKMFGLEMNAVNPHVSDNV